MKIEPVTLEGQHVRLEPLSYDHHAQLCEVGLDPDLWRWIPMRVTTPEEMTGFIRTALEWQAAGTALPFATITGGRAIGSTRFMNIDVANRHVEIGATWIGREHQRSIVNTEAKYLMLRHAFETLGCLRVELKTDALNRRSRNAIRRIGAREEGTFRKHVVTWSGRIRDSVYFSILDTEWPRVKADLEAKMKRGTPSPQTRIDGLSESQIEDLHRLYQNEWWTKDRTMEDVRRMLDATRVLVAFADPATGRLIAFARVITDFAFKALVLDVIVDPSGRKSGMGRALIDAVVGHPELAGVQHFELYCRPELMPFYERWGFKQVDRDLRFMRRG
ncbi:MAG TPA: GNAT family N-acetyltransferase [Bryobacteraceae bacterium]|nr:GNAT family N-acetyltransferase [Bryobacteraceae bacterium]